jgi:hypothetical protein
MRRRLHLVTFATAAFAAARDNLIESALDIGEFADAYSWDEKRLRDDPSFGGKPLLAHARGIGYWSWKPHIILDALNRAKDGDVVVYCDAGRYRGGFTIGRSVAPLVDFAASHNGMLPGVAVPQYGPSARWTRRDCFVLMNCDAPRFWAHPQVSATFSVWIKGSAALNFLEDWCAYCADVRIVGDGPNICGLPNHPEFVDHRHDQSVLTNLVVKHGATPFRIQDRLFEWLVSLKPNSRAAGNFCKRIDNISAVAAGISPASLYARDLFERKVAPSIGLRKGQTRDATRSSSRSRQQ